jgi:hypothetical protein
MKNIFAKFNKFNKLTSILKGFPGFLKKHYFIFLLAVLIIFVLWGAYIFWQFGIRIVNETPEVSKDNFRLPEKIFQSVSEGLKAREEFLPQALGKDYPDIFR